jgi:phenylalanyl-tRNA synthetase beta chain
MKISVNAIRALNARYGCAEEPAPSGIEGLVERIGARLAAVEETVEIGKKYQGIIIVKVINCYDHKNSDHLHVCRIDDGGAIKDVERDADGYVQVVCGAPNVRAGLTVAWLPPGSTVPSSFVDEPFVLTVREIRGEMSNGMLASPKELALGDNHDGILEIDEALIPGTNFADHYGLTDDVIIDMENKMFTHRPDCFGMLGIAREIAGIQGQKFTSPSWYNPDTTVAVPEHPLLRVEVRNEIPELVPRFVVVPMSGVAIKPSPVWLQVELSRLGVRPINNVVDLTNYHMLLTGQPLHAYDYDKVVALDTDNTSESDHAIIVIRRPNRDEKLTLLNGKTIEPLSNAIIISSRRKAIGLGGVMGGADTEIDDQTTNIILECATFDMYSIRRSSMANGIFTDAVTRFNKGQSPLQNMAVLAHIVEEMTQITGGIVAGAVIDDSHIPDDVTSRHTLHRPDDIKIDFINQRLGLKLSAHDMVQLLENVEFQAHDMGKQDNICMTAPFWRTDIEIPEDIVEEIGRLYGFDTLPLELPKRDLTPVTKNVMFELKSSIRDKLSRAGANELLTYSFIDGGLIDKVDQNRGLAFKLSNALSPDLQYFRLSLTPSLLDKVHANIRAGNNEFGLFEIGKAHVLGELDAAESDIPKEFNALSFVYSSKIPKVGAPYYQAVPYLQRLLDDYAVQDMISLEPLAGADLYDNPWIQQMVAPYVGNRSAVLRDKEGLIWGVVGEFKPHIRRALKLPDYTAGFELDPLLFIQPEAVPAARTSYFVRPNYPQISQDICLKVDIDLPFKQLHDFVWNQLIAERAPNCWQAISTVDIYQRPEETRYKQITFRFTIASYDKTMTDAEVGAMLDIVAAKATDKFGAERI